MVEKIGEVKFDCCVMVNRPCYIRKRDITNTILIRMRCQQKFYANQDV